MLTTARRTFVRNKPKPIHYNHSFPTTDFDRKAKHLGGKNTALWFGIINIVVDVFAAVVDCFQEFEVQMTDSVLRQHISTGTLRVVHKHSQKRERQRMQEQSQLRDGVEKHVWPAGNGQGVVDKKSSDDLFGANGLGLGRTFWTTILSFLARTGIQQQTGSNKGETNIENCVKGWGQGAYSSRVFDVHKGVDQRQLEQFIVHLQSIAAELNSPNGRITDKVLGSFIATQAPEPYSTINGVVQATSRRDRLGGIFRGHVQWQGFVTLCGQVDKNGVVHVTPELLHTFFNSAHPFFDSIIDRRRQLREGTLTPGDRSGVLADAPDHIDAEATDHRYNKNKSGLLIILKIIRYMLFPTRAKIGPLLRDVDV